MTTPATSANRGAVRVSTRELFFDLVFVFTLTRLTAVHFVVNAVHSGLFIVAGGPGATQAMVRLAPFNLSSATLILVGGFLPLGWRYALWDWRCSSCSPRRT